MHGVQVNPYETLGVPSDASAEAIKKAYRRRSSEAHPDRQEGDGRLMQEVNDAYALLSDPSRRRLYDETGERGNAANIKDVAQGLLSTELARILDAEAWANPAAALLEATVRIESQAMASYARNVDALNTIRNRSRSFAVNEGAEDFLRPVFTMRIEEAENAIKACEKLRAAAIAAREMLKGYRFDDFLRAQHTLRWTP
jgi:curved DNA-binding protein CbpA